MIYIIKQIKRYYYTIKDLKFNQIYHQLKYRILRYKYKDYKIKLNNKCSIYCDFLIPYNIINVIGNKYFLDILNDKEIFNNYIDWDYFYKDKLWLYILNYHDFLMQSNISVFEKNKIIDDFYNKRNKIKCGMEAYPISLRCFNMIKYSIKYNVNKYDEFIYSQLCLLNKNIEYHICGNHLLENIISLSLGATYYNIDKWKDKYYKLFVKELDEQILKDGAHYERSPTYHIVIFIRLLDFYNILIECKIPDNKFIVDYIKYVLCKMYGWLGNIVFNNHIIPDIKDTSQSFLMYSLKDIYDYSNRLGIIKSKNKLKDSGYRKIVYKDYEILFDIGSLSPKYIPGHAHADTLQFLLNYKGQPVIVDTGISTYNNNKLRIYQRSTLSHNTVILNNINSSDVWSSFRVGRKAKTKIIKDSENEIIAEHDGYKYLGVTHKRGINVNNDNIFISDKVDLDNKNDKTYFMLHYHDGIDVCIENNVVYAKGVVFEFKSPQNITITKMLYDLCKGFNKYKKAYKIKVEFRKELVTKIYSID